MTRGFCNREINIQARFAPRKLMRGVVAYVARSMGVRHRHLQWGLRRKGNGMSDASSTYSAVVEDILKLVWSAEEAGRDGVKPKDVSEHMGVVPSTATENIQRLARQGLVTHERY